MQRIIKFDIIKLLIVVNLDMVHVKMLCRAPFVRKYLYM